VIFDDWTSSCHSRTLPPPLGWVTSIIIDSLYEIDWSLLSFSKVCNTSHNIFEQNLTWPYMVKALQILKQNKVGRWKSTTYIEFSSSNRTLRYILVSYYVLSAGNLNGTRLIWLGLADSQTTWPPHPWWDATHPLANENYPYTVVSILNVNKSIRFKTTNVPQELYDPKIVVLLASHATFLKFGSAFDPTTS